VLGVRRYQPRFWKHEIKHPTFNPPSPRGRWAKEEHSTFNAKMLSEFDVRRSMFDVRCSMLEVFLFPAC
jgi:hypothetical protein